MRALSLPGCGCRVAFQFAVLARLVTAGERFELVGGASSGSLAGAAYVSNRCHEGPGILRAMGGTKVLSHRWIPSQKSPFGMSHIVRSALERHLPEADITRAPIELLVSTTSLGELIGHAVHRSGRPVVHSTHERQDIHDLLLASCTFPPFYAKIPRLDGALHLDGGITDNTLVDALVARGATEITIITPHHDGSVYRALFRGFQPHEVPRHVRLRVLHPVRPLRLKSFDFDPERVAEALAMPHRELQRSCLRAEFA